ncbi:MAG: carbamoyltransferase [bacterium]|nr:carbamoyltransferase [bacterium]
MRIMGMVSHTHDTGVALINDGRLEVVLEEERLNRDKKTKKFPVMSLNAALPERDLSIHDVDLITVPWHIPTFYRTLAWAIARKFPASRNLIHMRAHPPQQNQLFRGTGYLAKRLKEHFQTDQLPPIRGIGHHNSHAAAFFISPFEEATVLVMDGYGDDAATSAYSGVGNQLNRQWRTNLFNSLGILYTVVTQHLGFEANRDEGKVMGLAAYGESTYLEPFRDVIRLASDGQYQINMKYFAYDCYGLARPMKQLFMERFGPARIPGEEINQHHMDIAHALQKVVEEAILHVVRGLSRRFPSRNLVLVGGVALNCVANARILGETDYERVWIPPNASDTGATMGSALWHYHQVVGKNRDFELEHPFYGKEYSIDAVRSALDEIGMEFHELNDQELFRQVARDLADGKIVGWYQGRFEMGPRALGNRSILADPRNPEMKDILNRRVKFREPFRPFAPAVLCEEASNWFGLEQADPFMTIAPYVRREKRSLIPSGVHEDGTARIQTVDRTTNPRYYGVIEEFGRLTGVPIVLNTSFNRQEPIVASPEEAISCFLRTDMDVLVLGNYYSRDHNAASVERASQRFASRW